MDGGRISYINHCVSGKTGSLNASTLRSVASTTACILSPLLLLALGGCALRFETAGGDSWSIGLSRHTVKLEPLDQETALARESSGAAPLELAVIPFGIEAAFGWQQQARGFVIPNSVTNRFLPPSGVGFGNVNGWYLGFVHYRIPRESNRVRLFVNTLKGGALRVASADPYLKIGVSKTSLTTILEDPASGNVEYRFSSPAVDFNYSVQSIAPP